MNSFNNIHIYNISEWLIAMLKDDNSLFKIFEFIFIIYFFKFLSFIINFLIYYIYIVYIYKKNLLYYSNPSEVGRYVGTFRRTQKIVWGK